MLCRVARVKTDVSEEGITSIIRLKKSHRDRNVRNNYQFTAKVFPISPNPFHPNDGGGTFL
jgi:hypothetical protein